MANILMNRTAAGPNFILQAGQVYRVGSDLAKEMVSAGSARESTRPGSRPTRPDPGEVENLVGSEDE